jgi:hypothetical protein
MRTELFYDSTVGVISRLLPSNVAKTNASKVAPRTEWFGRVFGGNWYGFLVFADPKCLILIWLPPRDSNPDMLIQSQLSCR